MPGMTTSATDLAVPAATAARIVDDQLVVELADGRTITAPLTWYPRLVHATAAERANMRLIGRGHGMHWPDIEEDISVESILRGRASAESAASLKRWLATRGHVGP
jgi:hypothetical protein